MSVTAVQEAIKELNPQELEELYSWLDRFCSHPIDSRLQSDLAAGLLDSVIQNALADEANGQTKPL